MTVESLIVFLLIGAIAGWLAGVIMRGYSLGLVGNVIVGVIGSFVGGWLFAHFRLMHGGGLLESVVGATVGAVILLAILRLFRRPTLLQRLFHRGI